MTLHKTYHGGFKIGDIVQIRLMPTSSWSNLLYEVKAFEGVNVKVGCHSHVCSFKATVPMSRIRHPHLVEEVR